MSPDELHDAACREMLGGRRPETLEDWCVVANFWAANIDPGIAHPAANLMSLIYDAPLSEKLLRAIVDFQLSVRGEGTTREEE
jgi:hypothetical protein